MGVRWRAEEILNFARDCSHCTFVFTLEDAEKGTLFILNGIILVGISETL